MALGVLVCFGWALLLWNGTKPVTLHGDETLLLRNVIDLDVMDYAGPLKGFQVAPMGFMVLERLAIEAMGLSERSVRWVPLLAAIFSVPLFALLVRRVTTPLPGLVVFAGFVASQHWLLQAGRAKPYTLDVLFALLAIGGGLWLWDRLWGWREAVAASGVVVVGVWFSIPFYIMLGGVGLALLGACRSRERREWGWLALPGLLGLVSGAVHYAWVLRAQNAQEHAGGYMASYWADGFLPMPWQSPYGWVRGLAMGVDGATALALPGLVLGLVGLGAAGLIARREMRGAVLALPLLLALVASMAEVYPFSGRLVLYLAPSLLLLVALGLEELARRFQGRWKHALVLVAGAVLLSRPVQGRGVAPFEDDVMPVFEHIDAQYQPGQWVYLYTGAQKPYDFYTQHLDTDFAFPGDRVLHGNQHRDDWTRYTDEIAGLRGRGEVWIGMAHVYRFQGIDDERLFKMLLDRYGQRLDEYRGVGAFAILWRADPQAGDSVSE